MKVVLFVYVIKAIIIVYLLDFQDFQKQVLNDSISEKLTSARHLTSELHILFPSPYFRTS